jgi:hypothetical protein
VNKCQQWFDRSTLSVKSFTRECHQMIRGWIVTKGIYLNNLRLRGPLPSPSSYFHSECAAEKMADPQFEINGGFLTERYSCVDAHQSIWIALDALAIEVRTLEDHLRSWMSCGENPLRSIQ